MIGLGSPTMPPAAELYSAWTNWKPRPIGSRQGSSQGADAVTNSGRRDVRGNRGKHNKMAPAGTSDAFDLRTLATEAYAPSTTSADIPRSLWNTSTVTAARTAPPGGNKYGAGGRSNEPSLQGVDDQMAVIVKVNRDEPRQ